MKEVKERKMSIMKTIKKFLNALITSGFLVLIGTAGASDCGILSVVETSNQILFSAVLILSGFAVKYFILKINKRKKNKITCITEITA